MGSFPVGIDNSAEVDLEKECHDDQHCSSSDRSRLDLSYAVVKVLELRVFEAVVYHLKACAFIRDFVCKSDLVLFKSKECEVEVQHRNECDIGCKSGEENRPSESCVLEDHGNEGGHAKEVQRGSDEVRFQEEHDEVYRVQDSNQISAILDRDAAAATLGFTIHLFNY